jgi:hypothetical protein
MVDMVPGTWYLVLLVWYSSTLNVQVPSTTVRRPFFRPFFKTECAVERSVRLGGQACAPLFQFFNFSIRDIQIQTAADSEVGYGINPISMIIPELHKEAFQDCIKRGVAG